jgi:hypothetical protein
MLSNFQIQQMQTNAITHYRLNSNLKEDIFYDNLYIF